MIISDINNKDSVDKVVTSGLADQLPSGLYIGEVTKVENDQYGLAKQVRVKTGADMTDLTHMLLNVMSVLYLMKVVIINAYFYYFLIGILLFYIDTIIGLTIPMHFGKIDIIFVPHLTIMYILIMTVY